MAKHGVQSSRRERATTYALVVVAAMIAGFAVWFTVALGMAGDAL